MKRMKTVGFLFLLILSTIALSQELENSSYPYNNPVVTTDYTADAAPKVMPDGRVWMVTSIDLATGGGYSNMHSYRAYSSADMVNWIDHGEILHLEDLNEPVGENWALWAPDIIYKHGKYYLYMPLRNIKANGNHDTYVAVAVSDRMDQRFEMINHRMAGSDGGLDPSVFIDDDGEQYILWNRKEYAKLDDDMIHLSSSVSKLNGDIKNFMEAAWLHKRKGIYYYSYHTSYDKPVDKNNPDNPSRRKSHLDYCMANTPTGSYTYKGTMNYELGFGVENGPKYPGKDYVVWRLNQSNHGGIVEFHGQDYLFYHTSALSSFKLDNFQDAGDWTRRSVCVDSLNYNPDGTIIPVKQTIESVGSVAVNQPYEIKLDLASATKSNVTVLGSTLNFTSSAANIGFSSVDLGSGYYYLDLKVIESIGNGKVEVRLDAVDGTLCGTIKLNSNSESVNSGMLETFLREANGVHDVYLVFDLPGDATQYEFESPRFYAGAPLGYNKTARFLTPSHGQVFNFEDSIFVEVFEQTSGHLSVFDSVGLYINGVLSDTKLEQPYTWNSNTFNALDKLASGDHVLKIVAYNKNTSNEDYVNITILKENTDIVIQAEDYTNQNGIQTQNSTDAEDGGSGQQVAFIQNGDWCEYSIDISHAGTYPVKFRYAAPGAGSSIVVKREGLELGTFNLPGSGGWTSWLTTDEVDINFEKGANIIRTEYSGPGTGYLFNVNWLSIGYKKPVTVSVNNSDEIKVYPNPAENTLHIMLPENGLKSISIYNLAGQVVYSTETQQTNHQVDVSGIQTGLYVLHVKDDAHSYSSKVEVK